MVAGRKTSPTGVPREGAGRADSGRHPDDPPLVHVRLGAGFPDPAGDVAADGPGAWVHGALPAQDGGEGVVTTYAECAVGDCHERTSARGWCNRHYQQWRRWGDPLGKAPSREERFWVRVNKDGSVPECRPELGPCWVWTGGKHTGGYGSDGGRLAHRTSYELLVGPIPAGLQLDHLCRVRLCVRPQHLEPVTQRENIWRGESLSIVTARTNRCRRGHEMAGVNVYIVPKTGDRRCLACVAIREAAS
jgi:hypothetical protein